MSEAKPFCISKWAEHRRQSSTLPAKRWIETLSCCRTVL
jgi:hypothetical protein